MSFHRRSTLKLVRHKANEHIPQMAKTVELELRIARLEICCEEISVINKRLAALQAQLDHLLARLGRV